jgi:FkbM family methyltransferase
MWSMFDFFPEKFVVDVLDIGAAIGERPPYQDLVDAGRARIFGFEPNAEECAKLNAQYGAPHRFFPHFVGNGQSATFHETNWVLTGSLFEPNTELLSKFMNLAELVTPVAQHAVQTTKLDDVEGLDNVDFLKIDIQGGELAVFQYGAKALSQALFIQTEVEFVSLYKDQPLFADVDACLRKAGFQFHTFTGFGARSFHPIVIDNDPNKGVRQYLWSDAIYVRDWMNLPALDDLKLCKYAVLAHDIFRSFDLAHLVLQALDQRHGIDLAPRYLARLKAGIKPQ